MAYQAGNASGLFATGTLIQGLIFVNHPSYAAPAWQGTLLVIANVVIVSIFNLWGSRLIPYMQNGMFILHVLVLTAVVVPVWVLAPHASTTQVFATSIMVVGGEI